jgi:transposase
VDCGAHLHRDYNAAVNIYHKALTILNGQDTEEGDARDIEFGEYAI